MCLGGVLTQQDWTSVHAVRGASGCLSPREMEHHPPVGCHKYQSVSEITFSRLKNDYQPLFSNFATFDELLLIDWQKLYSSPQTINSLKHCNQ